MRLRELAASPVGFEDRRLIVILRRKGWRMNPKRLYRLYTEDGLMVRTKTCKKLAWCSRYRQPGLLRIHPLI
jgi:putative transposase